MCSIKADAADTGVKHLSQFPHFERSDLCERLFALLKVHSANRERIPAFTQVSH